jgi:TonB family protein
MRQPLAMSGMVALLFAFPVVVHTDTSAVNGQSLANEQASENTVIRRGVYRVGGAVSAPEIIYARDPEYSEEARKVRYEGTVVLWLIVDIDGAPHRIQVARSLGLGLDEQAVNAVQRWRFDPAKKGGQPVAVQINVPVSFRLDRNLSPHPKSVADSPRFPGVDIAKYPLVVKISPISTGAEDTRSAASRKAVITEAGGQKDVTISCDVQSLYCLIPDVGTYPARWLEDGKRLEVLGLDKKQLWEPAEYAVAAEPARAS